ncbi:hypothetical protein EVAR_65046_1 [Eumeta japonica]|uniref:Uncharacterized protein n=1 Tax=Eumeta variegata TaxID=151549 RepID=A0A4C1ZNC2_EUMVA|nr:hypothetical protein EVAR_65046_1 [Eumeta japonica]
MGAFGVNTCDKMAFPGVSISALRKARALKALNRPPCLTTFYRPVQKCEPTGFATVEICVAMGHYRFKTGAGETERTRGDLQTNYQVATVNQLEGGKPLCDDLTTQSSRDYNENKVIFRKKIFCSPFMFHTPAREEQKIASTVDEQPSKSGSIRMKSISCGKALDASLVQVEKEMKEMHPVDAYFAKVERFQKQSYFGATCEARAAINKSEHVTVSMILPTCHKNPYSEATVKEIRSVDSRDGAKIAVTKTY